MVTGGATCPTCGQHYPSGGYCANDGTQLVAASPSAGDALIGHTLDGRYQIQALLSPMRPGAIGTMYRGLQLAVSREVAIKVIHPQLAYDAAAVERFLHAGRRAAQLVAPAVAHVFDVGRSADGIVYVVSELARGRSLADYTGHALPLRRVVGLAIQLADALAAVHREQLIHGDLELASLVVDESSVGDQLKLVDVGLAAALGQRGWAPEALDGRPEPRSDLYAAGAIVHELLVGAPPFAASSAEALAGKHRRERPPQLPPHVPVPLATVIGRLLAKHPAERYATAGDLRAALLEVQALVGAPTASNPGIALPRTISDRPAVARTQSADYGMVPRTQSADLQRNTPMPAMPRTQSADYPQLPRTQSADYGMVPRTQSADHGMAARTSSRDLPPVAQTPAPQGSSRRWLVIVLVALIASGGGIAAILLAG